MERGAHEGGGAGAGEGVGDGASPAAQAGISESERRATSVSEREGQYLSQREKGNIRVRERRAISESEGAPAARPAIAAQQGISAVISLRRPPVKPVAKSQATRGRPVAASCLVAAGERASVASTRTPPDAADQARIGRARAVPGPAGGVWLKLRPWSCRCTGAVPPCPWCRIERPLAVAMPGESDRPPACGEGPPWSPC